MASCFCQCAHLVQKREDYAISGDEPTVNGARLTAEMLTTDGKSNFSFSAMVYFMAGETETGPYKCLFTAWDDRGMHQSMTVENLTFRTANGQTAAAPKSGRLPFAERSDGQGWQATYVMPGVLSLDYAKDGDVTIDATVAIRSKRRTTRKKVRLVFVPTESKEVRFATILDEFKRGKDEEF
ncbi:MAG: hypothetical protein ACI8T1_004540 [Verrucomicrobiales bacterium]|jgi:hypothetical protein